jgi:hypothetical protein
MDDTTTSSKRKLADEEEQHDAPLVNDGHGDNEGGGDGDVDGEEARQLEAKRAYNRLNAARARKRTKDHLAELCRKIEALSDKNSTIEGKNEELMKRIAVLAEENNVLRRFLVDADAASVAASSRSTMAPLYTMNSSTVGPSLAASLNPAHKLAAMGPQPLLPPGTTMAASHNYAPSGGPTLWNFQNHQQSSMF